MPSITDTMKNILPMIDGPKSLTSRVTALEMQMVNGTAVSTLPAKGVIYLFISFLLTNCIK